MLYRTGTIVEISERFARVEFEDPVACGGCASGHGCGLGPLLAMFRRSGSRWLDLPVRNGHAMRVGDRVCTALPAGELVKSAGSAYLLPMGGLLAGAWLATVMFPGGGDPGACAGAVTGIAATWFGLRFGTFGYRTKLRSRTDASVEISG